MLMFTLDAIIREKTLERLDLCHGNHKRTAASLGIGLRTLSMWISKWEKAGEIREGKIMNDQTEEKLPAGLNMLDVSGEQYRIYSWFDPATGKEVSKTFNKPRRIYWRNGGSTHRVLVAGREDMVIVPAPGWFGCTITISGPLVS